MPDAWDQEALERCALCPELSHNHVSAEGSRSADLMVVGQSPGVEEVKHKRPFVGKSGKLLIQLLTELLLRRSEVYITNVVKCHPMLNRPSTADEIDICSRHYLFREIKTVAPSVILCLGRDAHMTVIRKGKPDAPFQGFYRTRSKHRSYVSTYHPAYWLRRGQPETFLRAAPILREELDFWNNV